MKGKRKLGKDEVRYLAKYNKLQRTLLRSISEKTSADYAANPGAAEYFAPNMTQIVLTNSSNYDSRQLYTVKGTVTHKHPQK